MDNREQDTSAHINSNSQIEIKLGKKITEHDYVTLITKVYDLALELEDKQLPVNLLVDCTQLAEMEPVAEQHAVKGTRDLMFNRIASFGLDPKYMALLGSILAEAAPEDPNAIKNFETKNDAESWLRS